ncbi:MAG: CRISPR system precrRNA processing endoribonuclease RAMP protein Cas6 [Deltaproteobacteria bacterium]|nr:CRISPR system precrRNA processing endoribonuclease RAMP protein Cas6 [Deltaproteobacteria bacterium]
MSYLPPLPPELQRVEYVQLYLHLQINESFDLPRLGLLQLRRELRQLLRTFEVWGGEGDAAQLRLLLQPPLPVDPLVRRQVQQPAPAFVMAPDPDLYGPIKAQQRLVLPVLFIGRGLQQIDLFISLLQQLGQQGLYHGRGRFVLEGLEAEDASGVRAMLWTGGRTGPILPPVSDLHWWLERQTLNVEQVTLEVISPLRLLQQKKPLFKATFSDLFPFILRRVSAMLACHAGVEVIKNPRYLHDLAGQVAVVENCLRWQDWRHLAGADRGQDLGGLLGTLQLTGHQLAEIFWVLQLGSRLNIGKGAAYGAGQYRLKGSVVS